MYCSMTEMTSPPSGFGTAFARAPSPLSLLPPPLLLCSSPSPSATGIVSRVCCTTRQSPPESLPRLLSPLPCPPLPALLPLESAPLKWPPAHWQSRIPLRLLHYKIQRMTIKYYTIQYLHLAPLPSYAIRYTLHLPTIPHSLAPPPLPLPPLPLQSSQNVALPS